MKAENAERDVSLSRRGFIGAAAGTSVLAGGATVALRSNAFAESDPSAHDAPIPIWNIGIQCYVTRAVLSNSTNGGASPTQSEQWMNTIVSNYKNIAVETYGDNYGGFGVSSSLADRTAGWRQQVEQRGGYCWGDHNGGGLGNSGVPSTTAINTALTRMNGLGSPTVGTASANVPGFTGTYNVAQAHTAAQRMNSWGGWLQTPPVGVTQPGVEGATYYFHPHQNEWALITAGTSSGEPEWVGNRILEVTFADLDPDFGMIEVDLAWARHNTAMGPSAGSLYIDLMREYEPQIYAYHVKGMSGTAEVDCNLPPFQTGSPGSAVDPYTGSTVQGNAADNLPWQDLFDTMKWPERKKFLWERDGPGSGLTGTALMTAFSRFGALLHGAQLDRSAIGAPANVEVPQQVGPALVGKKQRCEGEDRGEWTRAYHARYSHTWLRNGTQPIPGATRPHYLVSAADDGKSIVGAITIETASGSTTELTLGAPVGNPPEDPGPVNVDPPTLSGSGKAGTMIDCFPGEWAGGGTTSFQWFFAVAPTTPVDNDSTNPKRFRTNASQIGESVICKVTRTNGSGSTTLTTNAIAVIPRT